MTPWRSALTLAVQLSRERQATSSLKKTPILYYFAMLSMVNRAACLQQGHLTSLLQLWLQRSWQSAGSYFPPDTSAPTWSCQLPRPGSSPPSPAPAPWGLGHYALEGCLPGSCPASARVNSDRYSCPAQHEENSFFPQFSGTYNVIPMSFDRGRCKSQAKPYSLQENRWVDRMCNPSTCFPIPSL